MNENISETRKIFLKIYERNRLVGGGARASNLTVEADTV
jgi:hypothetical protein